MDLPAQFRSPKGPLSSLEDHGVRKHHEDFTANRWHLNPVIRTRVFLQPSTTYIGYWLIWDWEDWSEDLYYWIKTFLETLKSLEDLQQLTMTQTPWAVNLDGVAAKTKYNEMRSCANWAICVTLRDKMNFSDLTFNNRHTRNSRQSINTGRPLFPLLLKEKG